MVCLLRCNRPITGLEVGWHLKKKVCVLNFNLKLVTLRVFIFKAVPVKSHHVKSRSCQAVIRELTTLSGVIRI